MIHIKKLVNSEPLFLKWNPRKIRKVPIFITKTLTNDHKMPQHVSNLTHYKTVMIKKQHRLHQFYGDSQWLARLLLERRYCVLFTTVSLHTTTPHRGNGQNWALNKFYWINNISSDLISKYYMCPLFFQLPKCCAMTHFQSKSQ